MIPVAPAPIAYPAEEGEKTERFSGFIFMCNPSTKLECYKYRVFGLPLVKKDVVEEIKPGVMLFLYDFELKLVYGVYEATSSGNLNLEPAAFRGKFPAQVKFKIFRECLPLPESSLRHIIKENYTGSKFNQELSKMQVEKLISSFRPLAASSLHAPQAFANVSLPLAMPPSAVENQFMHRAVMEVPLIPRIQYSLTRPLLGPQTVPKENYFQQGYYRTATYMENLHPTLDHRSLPSTNSYYVANSQQPYFSQGVTHTVRESLYSRYRPIEERTAHVQATSLERRSMTMDGRHTQQRASTLHQDSSNPLQNTSLVMQTPAPATAGHPYPHQFLLQRYQDNIATHSSSSAAQTAYTDGSVSELYIPPHSSSNATNPAYVRPHSLSHGTVPTYVPSRSFPDASVPAYVPAHSVPNASVTTYVPAHSYSDATLAIQYASASITAQQPQVAFHHAPITPYNAYPATNQLNR